MDIKEKIDKANEKAIEIFTTARPTWVDVQLAIDVIPGMTENTILVAGPPLAVEDISPPVRTSISGALIYEGLASSLEEAWKLVESGAVSIGAAQDYDAACGAAMALSAHMHVIVCEDKKYGGKGYCAPHPGNFPNVLRWGFYNDKIQKDLEWFRDYYCPALSETIRKHGGIDLVNVLTKTAGMGDENHNRQPAASMYMATQLIQTMMDCTFPHKEEIVKQYAANDRFFLHVMMAGVESVVSSIKGIPYSTVLTGMGGNGVTFGLQFAGTGRQWFTADAPLIDGLYLRPTYTAQDLLGYLGDSCVTEIYGLGGMSAIAGPGYVCLTGGTFADAKQRTEDARAVSLGEHKFMAIPWDDNKGIPVGIDMRKVIGLNILPTSHGGGTLRCGGQGTMGSAKLPMECFKKGLEAFSMKIRNEG